jgi:phage terminase small subunit
MAKEIVKKTSRNKYMAFCREYVKDYNGTQAAIRAGYSKKTAQVQSSQLLLKLMVQEEILRRERQLENRINISKDKILKELAVIGFSNIDEYLDIDGGGFIKAKSFDEMPAGASKAIKKVEEKRTIRQTQDDSEDIIMDSTFKFELYDKLQALIAMGKELGMFRERRELSGPDGQPLAGANVNVTMNPMEAAVKIAYLFREVIEEKKRLGLIETKKQAELIEQKQANNDH